MKIPGLKKTQFPNRIHIQTIVSEPDTTYCRIENLKKHQTEEQERNPAVSPYRQRSLRTHIDSTGARQNKNSRQATSTYRAVLSWRSPQRRGACGGAAGRGRRGGGGVPARARPSSAAAGWRNHSERVRIRARCRSCTYRPSHLIPPAL